ncbi:MAG: hypothetical protein AAFR67_05335, partial [Chloroflexota bacterium]
ICRDEYHSLAGRTRRDASTTCRSWRLSIYPKNVCRGRLMCRPERAQTQQRPNMDLGIASKRKPHN